MKRRLVTSALPYVNNVPHLGNLIQVLSADAFARFCRLRGYETLYICGTDEYGTATETRAAEEGTSPRELCDRYHAVHAGIYRWFNIAFDKFGRTSTPIQTEVTQDIFRKLDLAGYITEREVEQLYCDSCGRFLADRYIRGNCPQCGYADARGDQCEQCGKLLDPTELGEPRCSVCGMKPRPRTTRHLYLDLPKIKDRLEGWIETASKEGFWANNAVRMTAAWIRDGLRERAITRDLKWGIPVPKQGYENKVFYVWFDAPIGYISITGCLGEERGAGGWKAFVDYWWKSPGETELFQFIGKDNIPFHTVIFPSSLLGSGGGWTMLHHMSSTEYLNYESGKFSKSKGIGVFGTDVMETGIPADVWRFYIFYNRPEKADALFTWKDFQEKVNGELIGNLGNLVNRTLSFVRRYYGGTIPGAGDGGDGDSSFIGEVRRYEEDIARRLERAELRDAFRLVFELSSLANKRFQDTEPWRLRKDDPPRAAVVIRELALVVRDMAVLTGPYMPDAAAKIASFFGLVPEKDLSWEDLGRAGKMDGTVTSEVLFAKLEDEKIGELRNRYSGSQKERQAEGSRKDGLDISGAPGPKPPSFTSTLDLRVAEIVKIERHPGADRLYVETLDIAGEERIIVSGLVPFYREEELLGKRIIVVYNLAAAKLRGVESRGMLLAASDHRGEGGAERVEVLDASGVPEGTRVLPEGVEAGDVPAEIDIDAFFAVPITVRDNTVFADGKPLTLAGKPLRTGIISDGGVH
ncbi:MAG: methionine--tRNA ligase [Treponema sp.]|jgi:methionyl-tRNA synthetase|nr:methionine--tRNA ligase [Treponema sp.]